jgi:ABC-type glycerol-3-phosphate transport system permease component
MNRAFYIILIPAFLVAIGYLVVFRSMGISPGYWRLILPAAFLGGALWFFARRPAAKTRRGSQ